jgi:N-acetylmuramidase
MSLPPPKDPPADWQLPTAGAALPLVSSDITNAANQLGVEPCAVHAVTQVESSGAGFDSKRRPKLRYENHWFRTFTNGQFDDSNPDLSCAQGSSGYAATHTGDGDAYADQQWDLLRRAFQLNKTAAVKSCSWGMFQVMGFNADKAGWGTDEPGLRKFVEAMFYSEGQHVHAFCGFVEATGLVDTLKDHDWASFAQSYNGDGYRQNAYDTKMAQFYADCAG